MDDFCEKFGSDPLDVLIQFFMWSWNDDWPTHSFIAKFGVLIRKNEVLESELGHFLLSHAYRVTLVNIDPPKKGLQLTAPERNITIDEEIFNVLFRNEFLAGGVEPIEERCWGEFRLLSQHFL